MIFDQHQSEDKQDWEGLLPPETNEAYHQRNGLSSSLLKQRIPNAYNFKASLSTPDADKFKSSSLDVGSCAHEILLTNDRSQFVVLPDFRPITQKDFYRSGPRKGMEYDKVIKTITEQKEEFLEFNPGRLITSEQGRKLDAMMSYIAKKKTVMDFLKSPSTLFEQGYLYSDMGEKCMFRADAINPEIGEIYDYKTTQDASPYAFKKSIERYYYHLSAAHYVAGAQRIYQKPFKFIFIAQESSYPYKVGLYDLSMSTITAANLMRRDLIRLIQNERKTSTFPDYADRGIKTLQLAGYAFEIDEERT